MTNAGLKLRQANRLPWPVIGAALVSFYALYITSGRSPTFLLLAILLACTRLVDWRIPGHWLIIWPIRIMLLSAVAMFVGVPTTDAALLIYKPEYTNLFGALMAAELLLRSWQRWRSRIREGRGVAILLSALIILMASNTYSRYPIRLLAPIYLILAIVSFHSFSQLDANGTDPDEAGRDDAPEFNSAAKLRSGDSSEFSASWRFANASKIAIGAQIANASGPLASIRRWIGRPDLLILRGLAMFVALYLGSYAIQQVRAYDMQLSNLAARFMREPPDHRVFSGLNAAPRLRSVFSITDSLNRVMVIDGPLGDRYLRTMAFDRFDGSVWFPRTIDRPCRPVHSGDLDTAEPGQRLHITLLKSELDMMPLPLEAASVDCVDPMVISDNGVVRDIAGGTKSYDITEPKSETFQGPLCIPPIRQLEALLSIPARLDPRIIDLSRKIAGDGTGLLRLRRLQLWLRSTHGYSTVFNSQGDPLADFILNNRPAHCQYFATALVMMARCVGIPARYVSGYFAHEAYASNQTVVRDRDAHAWVECWIPGTGWITADATPSNGMPDAMFPKTSFEQWREHFVDDLLAIWKAITLTPATFFFTLLGTASGLFLLGALIRFAWVEMGRRRSDSRRAYASAGAEIAAAARRFDLWLKSLGTSRAANQTWRDQLVAIQNPGDQGFSRKPVPAERVESALRFVSAYDEARFGAGAPEDLSRVRELLEQLERKSD